MSDSLGSARGRILIDTSGVRAAQREVQAASRGMSQALQQLGLAFGVQQVARFVVEADRVATSFRRQSIAARELAGSQDQLNTLLQVYNDATGNAIGRAQALSDVTRLLAVGFADSAEELDEFARAARGISIATGQSQEYVISQLQLAIANQSTLRLDQLGLGVAEVQQRIDELKASNKGLTTEMAYQQAVLEAATRKFGKLTESAEAQATGVERLGKAWADFQLQFGEDASGGVNIIFNQWADDIERARQELETFANLLEQVERAGRQFRFNLGMRDLSPDTEDFIARSRSTPFVDDSQARSGGRAAPTGFTPDQQTAITEWSREIADIERQANRDRLDATRQYEQQRTDTIRQYEQTIAREAQDFAIGRARAEEDYARGLERFRRDVAQREARQLEDLERTIAEARTNAAEQATDRQVALDERLAEVRATSRERVAEMEEDFQRRRERAARDHQEGLMEAAGRLDALAIARQQREFIKRRRDEQEDFDVRLNRERKNEEKRLADLEKANAKQVADQQKALDKQIRQANEAYQRQLDDARAADEQRLTDMSADFELRKTRENEDRAIRLERLKEDHDAQLAEQARQHEDRLIQIAEQEADEIQLANEAFDARMADLNIFHDGVKEREQAHYTRGLIAYQQYLDAQEAELARRTAQQGPMASPWAGPTFGGTPSAVTPSSVATGSRSSSLVVNAGAIQIFPAIGQSPRDIAAEVRNEFNRILQELSR